MSDSKITVSLDEVNSTAVEAEVHRQEIAARMAAHQETVRRNFEVDGGLPDTKGGLFRKAFFVLPFFALIFSILAWMGGEITWSIREKNPKIQVFEILHVLYTTNPNLSDAELKETLSSIKENVPQYRNNYYLDRVLNMSDEEMTKLINDAQISAGLLNICWYVIICAIIGYGLSFADGYLLKGFPSATLLGIPGGMLGALGGFIGSFICEGVYRVLGGGNMQNGILLQIVARSIAWGFLGLFVAVAPGILMKNWKKFWLGLVGGFIGGFLGGLLFDVIGKTTESAVLSRFVNIIGLGVGAAVATVFLENVAKQGWLKVAAGLITGKQFILYRNPTVIGSSPKSEIYLFKDPQIAPKHAAINKIDNDFVITSIENAAVLLNGRPVSQEKLKSGDRIRIGNTTFVFEAKAIKNKQ